ncbi:OmpA family protein [Duganella sp. BJB488]|uniref:OmpA family protein n=1 Tax=unclassified Duganella TaxID=2636909 RepID=UPI000E350DDC|nr:MULTISPECIES: OmpA family protein [unclassified Duganella]RFP11053.1 OmpA family protein [Duganella sp. BJB489]RFP14399.1 OmpA family protein [Duganella sp. BJB488]RFP30334.1 OmpA family protein [Duganella sp. BJB480]
MGMLIWIACLLAAVSQQRTPTEQITLLPSQDGKASAVVITTAGVDTVLDQPYQTAAIDSKGATVSTGNGADIGSRYASTLTAMPQRAAVFTLYFVTDTDALVPESAARLADIKAQLAARPAPEIIVIGHTDTVAKQAYNDELSLRRAATVKQMLVEVGIEADRIAVQGRGKRELLVPTADGVDEPRNRRVEIRVR